MVARQRPGVRWLRGKSKALASATPPRAGTAGETVAKLRAEAIRPREHGFGGLSAPHRPKRRHAAALRDAPAPFAGAFAKARV